jgi:large subunit ribosomal protein L12
MEYVYAALMLHSAKKDINEANVKKIVEAAGFPVEEAKAKALIASLQGVNIDEAIKQSVIAAAPVQAQAAPAEKKKEEKKEEAKTEEEAAGGLAALFG